MGLDIYFSEDIYNALRALGQANERLLDLAETYGMNPEVARLCHEVYNGALGDVGQAFGLALGKPAEPTKTPLHIPYRKAVSCDEYQKERTEGDGEI